MIGGLAVGRAGEILVGRRHGADDGSNGDILVDVEAVGGGNDRRVVQIGDGDGDGRQVLEAAGGAGIVADHDLVVGGRRRRLIVERAVDRDHAGGGVDRIAAVGGGSAVHAAAPEIIAQLAVGGAGAVLVGRGDAADHGSGGDILVDAEAVGLGDVRRVVGVADGDVDDGAVLEAAGGAGIVARRDVVGRRRRAALKVRARRRR